VGLFKERKRIALLSILSALVVASTAFVGISIYAQSDGSQLTTFEEEEKNAGVDVEDEESTTSTAAVNTTAETSISAVDIDALLNGMAICDVGTAEISGQTGVASADDASMPTPTVSVEVMTETEVASLASNETQTASTGNETSIASANCIEVGASNATSTASGNATEGANATSTAGSNATAMSNLTSSANTTSTASLGANTTSTGSNATSTASTPSSDRQILVINGQDFAPGQAVLIFSDYGVLGIDDVDSNGNIEIKAPVPGSGQTTTASNDTGNTTTELRFVETGTQRTGTFEFDGQTLTAAASGDIKAESGGATMPAQAPPANATSTNSTSTSNTSTSSSPTPQY
jgi:hypothetical protein